MSKYLALPLGELSPQVTERVLLFLLNDMSDSRAVSALSVFAALGHLSQRERQEVTAGYTNEM